MNKRVNIFPRNPILTVNPPLRTAVRATTKSEYFIKKCLEERAFVEEVFPDGKKVVLTLDNYNVDNSNVKNEVKEHKKPERIENPFVKPEAKFVEPPKIEPQPVNEPFVQIETKENLEASANAEPQPTDSNSTELVQNVNREHNNIPVESRRERRARLAREKEEAEKQSQQEQPVEESASV